MDFHRTVVGAIHGREKVARGREHFGVLHNAISGRDHGDGGRSLVRDNENAVAIFLESEFGDGNFGEPGDLVDGLGEGLNGMGADGQAAPAVGQAIDGFHTWPYE